MLQMVCWSSCEKGHDLHPGTHSGLNAGTCVLENKAFSLGPLFGPRRPAKSPLRRHAGPIPECQQLSAKGTFCVKLTASAHLPVGGCSARNHGAGTLAPKRRRSRRTEKTPISAPRFYPAWRIVDKTFTARAAVNPRAMRSEGGPVQIRYTVPRACQNHFGKHDAAYRRLSRHLFQSLWRTAGPATRCRLRQPGPKL
jgi:hypothetical protein